MIEKEIIRYWRKVRWKSHQKVKKFLLKHLVDKDDLERALIENSFRLTSFHDSNRVSRAYVSYDTKYVAMISIEANIYSIDWKRGVSSFEKSVVLDVLEKKYKIKII